MPKILILIPAAGAKGGIVNYFKVLKKYLGEDVRYFLRGNRTWPHRSSPAAEFGRLILDYLRFIKLIANSNFEIIQTNTSLHSMSLFRDSIFILISRLFGKKVIVFFRGWHKKDEVKINSYFLSFFRLFFFKADSFIVLAEDFKKRLEDWGYKKEIYVETTIVDESLIKGYSEEQIIHKYENNGPGFNILYLARVEKEKGIYEFIKACKKVRESFDLHVTIAGDGLELDRVKEFVAKEEITNITFAGFVSGTDKIEKYRNAHIYVLPSYTEGMPNSVLEAMAFGLPVITTPVGGIPDFFAENEMGYLVSPKTPDEIEKKLQILMTDKKKMLSMALFNFHFAKNNFLSGVVVNRLRLIYRNVHNKI